MNASKFIELLETCDLRQHVTSATHKDGHILDLVITRADESFLSDFNVFQPGISDHLAIQCSFSFCKESLDRKKFKSRNLRSVDVISFCDDVVNSPLTDVQSDDIDSLVNGYNSTLTSILDRHAPLKSRVVTCRPASPWFNQGILKAKRKRRKYERVWRLSKNKDDHALFTAQCIVVNNLVKEAKENYYSSIIDENMGNQRVLFRCVDALLNRKSVPRYPSSSSDSALAESFINFFADKIKIIRDSFPNVEYNGTAGDDTMHHNCEFSSFQPVTIDDLSTCINTMKLKSCKLDPLPASILKHCLTTLLPVILKIVNLSLVNAIVPESLKTALVIPLLKKPDLDVEDHKNFRPVSNLPFISKVIEKIVSSQLLDYLEANILLEPYQSAYKKLHSTETALLKVQDDILLAIDNNKSVVLLLLDLSAAFDTVDHSLLLNRLCSRFGINGNALHWFKSYLQGRQQFVHIKGCDSSYSKLLYGVPQGSVLGPILYLLYTSPLGGILRRHNMLFHFYADDSQIYFSFESATPVDCTSSKIEACIADVKNWMVSNKLKLNTDKTELLVISSKFRLRPVLLGVIVGNDVVAPSESARNIGVIFDSNLDYKKHVNAICRSCFFHIRNLSRIRKFLSADNIKILVHAFIISRLDNCNSLLYGLPSYLIHKLQLVQNCAARLILYKSKFDRITPLLKELHWLLVQERIVFKILLITYKALNNLSPSYISSLLNRYIPSRSLRSSSKSLLQVPRSNLKSYGDRAFSVCAPKLWNSLPDDIKFSTSITIFKTKLKTHLFRSTFSY